MVTTKLRKRVAIILTVVFLLLWFGGNLGLYLSFSKLTGSAFDYIPEKLSLSQADLKAQALPFDGIVINLPFDREKFGEVAPLFLNGKLYSVSLRIKNSERTAMVHLNVMSDELKAADSSFLTAVRDSLLTTEESFYALMKASHYSRVDDYSWWNLIHNIRLSAHLVFKVMGRAGGAQPKMYEVATPYLKGILTEQENKKGGRLMVDLIFAEDKKYYSITFFSVPPEHLSEIRSILAGIQPLGDKSKAYQEMKNAFDRKANSQFSEELLLVSMMSLKGPTVDDMNQLLAVMKAKDYKPFYIDSLKEQIGEISRGAPSKQ